jgi:ATP-dependent Clp protease adaptor protein ClpS
MSEKTRRDAQGDTAVRERTEEPRRYKVLLLNDHYTSMEFVVWVLMEIFRHTQASATRVMLGIHRSGVGVAGVYTKEIADTRIEEVHEAARAAGHPLQAILEPE